jgi:hypothetical protein
MTVEEVKEKKRILKNKIELLINNFSKETGCTISTIDLTPIYENDLFIINIINIRVNL